MEWEHLHTAKLEARMQDLEAEKSVLCAEQAEIIAELNRRDVATTAGCRTLTEWVTGRLDLSRRSARRLVEMSGLDAEFLEELADGDISVDRALAEARLAAEDPPDRVRSQSRAWNVDSVDRLAARHRRLRRRSEREATAERYLTLQPSLDGSLYRVDGLLPGVSGQLLAAAVDAHADSLPDLPGGRGTVAQRRADALVAMALGATGDPAAAPSLIATVFVDGETAAATGGEAGAEMVGGPRIGPDTLEAILCSGRVEVDIEGATPLGAGPAGHGTPPRLRRYVLARDGGQCTADGCTSTHLLQVHHVVPRSHGGTNDPNHLTTQCWFHHMVVIHGLGYRIDPNSPPQRRRYLPP